MYTVRSTKKYRTSIKKIGLSGNKKAVQEIEYVVSLLTAGKVLPQKYRDHVLIGDMNGVGDGFRVVREQPRHLVSGL